MAHDLQYHLRFAIHSLTIIVTVNLKFYVVVSAITNKCCDVWLSFNICDGSRCFHFCVDFLYLTIVVRLALLRELRRVRQFVVRKIHSFIHSLYSVISIRIKSKYLLLVFQFLL